MYRIRFVSLQSQAGEGSDELVHASVRVQPLSLLIARAVNLATRGWALAAGLADDEKDEQMRHHLRRKSDILRSLTELGDWILSVVRRLAVDVKVVPVSDDPIPEGEGGPLDPVPEENDPDYQRIEALLQWHLQDLFSRVQEILRRFGYCVLIGPEQEPEPAVQSSPSDEGPLPESP